MKTAGVSGPDPIDLHVGLELKSRRAKANMTQSDLARPLGITFQQVQKYENGANRISASMLARAAVALGCAVADFFPAPGSTPNDNDAPHIGAVPGGHVMARIYSALGQNKRGLLLNLARELARRDGEPITDRPSQVGHQTRR